MGKWTLIDTLKQRVWLQNVLVFAPLVLILLYIGFFILDFVSIVGIIEYNNDVLSMVNKDFLYAVDIRTVDDKYYLHYKDVEVTGNATIKKGEKILDLIYDTVDTYKVEFSNGTTGTIAGAYLPEELGFEKPNESILVLSIYLSDDGSYLIKYPDNTEQTKDNISFLQYEQKGDEYTFSPMYIDVYEKSKLPEMITSSLPETGYYLDKEGSVLLHNDGNGAMQIFLIASHIITVIAVFLLYTIIVFILRRNKDLVVFNSRWLVVEYVIVNIALIGIFIIANFIYS